jgi:1-acyl-sn-glycerol-3-phosphate acyltransferase
VRTEIISENEYHTPEDTPRYLLDRMMFNSRIVFMYHFIKSIFRTRSEAYKGIYDTQHWIDSSHEIFTYIEQCGGKFHITGFDHLRNSQGPVVILSNHMSTLETMIFPGIIQPLKEVTFVVKDELVRHWAFGAVMRSRHPIVLSRSNPREDFRIVMDQGFESLKKGISVIIFPQSTRRIHFLASEFNSIGTKLAARAGVQVIPVAIKTDFWGNGKFTGYLGPLDRRKPIHIAFGSPINVSGNGKKEHQHMIDFIRNHLSLWDDTK